MRAHSRLAEVVLRRPILPAVALFIAGIAAHEAVDLPPPVLLAAMATLLAAAGITLRRPLLCSTLLALTVLLGGLSAGRLAHFYYPTTDVNAYASDDRRLAQLELYLDHEPRLIANTFGPSGPSPPKQSTVATVTAVRTWRGWAPAAGTVLVQINEPHPRLAAGQTIRLLGLLERPAPAANPGQFDWADYYRDQRVLTSVRVQSAANLQIIREQNPGPVADLRAAVRRALGVGFSTRQTLDLALLRALLLGDRDPAMQDVKDQFRATGTSHHLAISGMHVAVLGGVVYGLGRLLRIRPRPLLIGSTAFVILYGLIALPAPPVLRAVIIWTTFAAGFLICRKPDPLQLLALACLALLVLNPLDLFNAGFQLSFGTVLGLVLFAGPFFTKLTGPAADDARFDRPHRPVGPLVTAGRWLDVRCLQAVAAGVVAWLVSMPLVAYHFEQLNPWAVLCSILLSFPVMASLVAGLAKVVLTLAWPGMATAWAALAALPVDAMRWMVGGLAQLPMADVPLPRPPLWLLVAFYCVVPLFFLRLPTPTLRWASFGGTATACLALVALPFQTSITRAPASADEVRLTLLAVGAGQCAVVEPPGGRITLVDAGSSSLSDPVDQCIGPYLRSRGATGIEQIFVSHANTDHFGAVPELADAYGAREVCIADGWAREARVNPAAAGFLREMKRLDHPPRVVRPGDVIPLGRGTQIEILWPPPGLSVEANDESMVLKLTHAGRSVLFTGDIEGGAMRGLMDDPASREKLKSDVLIAPHHGSSEPETAAFLAAVDPTYIVASNARRLTGKQRAFDELVGRRPLLRTHAGGAVTIRLGGDGGVSVEPFLPIPKSPGGSSAR